MIVGSDFGEATTERVNGCVYHYGESGVKGTDAGTDTGCTRVYAVSHDEYSTVEFSGGETEAIGGETYYKTGAKFTLGHTEKTGYEFTGWTVKDIDGGDAAVDGGTFTLGEKDAVVSAVWKAVRYTLSYELGEGSAENPASYTIESPDFTLNAPTKAGQKFMGWTDTDLAGATVNVTITKGSTGNRTYTATWGEYPNTYNVSTPAGLNITRIGWNSEAGVITASAVSGDFDPDKKIVITVTSPNDWYLVDSVVSHFNPDKIHYTLKAKSTDTASTTSWTFTSADLFKSGGTTITFGAMVDDFSSKRPGSYEDPVVFHVDIE